MCVLLNICLMRRTMLTLLLLLLMTSSCGADSELFFTSSTLEVQVPVTEKLTIRCWLYDVITPSTTVATSLVGRDIPPTSGESDFPVKDPGEFMLRSSHRASTFKDPVRHTTSMSITRDGVTIATVSSYTSASIVSEIDKSNLYVSGDVSKTTGELGFLQLEWVFPTDTQSGHYECSANGVTESGQMARFSKTLSVQKSTAELEDLVRELQTLKKTVHQQNMSLVEQEKLNRQQQEKMAEMATEIQASRHIETGHILCNDSNTWSTNTKGPDSKGIHPLWDYYMRENRIDQVFQTEYPTPPVVFLSISHLTLNQDQNIEMGTQVITVDRQGFSMRCGTYISKHVHDLEVTWISIPGL